MVDVHTPGYADKDVVEKAVRFIRPANDLVLRVAVAVFLCHDSHSSECQSGGQKTFSNRFHGFLHFNSIQ